MFEIRKSQKRGQANHGWLYSQHSFSFANYYDPNFMGFRCLRVINDDQVAPSKGFGMHGHSNMEILSYVIDGELQHQDSMGNKGIIKRGEIQYMSAGTGVRHSEFNASATEKVHFLQIWIVPKVQGTQPRYGQIDIEEQRHNQLSCIVDGMDCTENAISIYQDVRLFNSISKQGCTFQHSFAANRYGWIQMIQGRLSISDGENVVALSKGDGLAISQVQNATITVLEDAEFLLFDLP